MRFYPAKVKEVIRVTGSESESESFSRDLTISHLGACVLERYLSATMESE